jgi:hypothetical protein
MIAAVADCGAIRPLRSSTSTRIQRWKNATTSGAGADGERLRDLLHVLDRAKLVAALAGDGETC